MSKKKKIIESTPCNWRDVEIFWDALTFPLTQYMDKISQLIIAHKTKKVDGT